MKEVHLNGIYILRYVLVFVGHCFIVIGNVRIDPPAMYVGKVLYGKNTDRKNPQF
jgi:hypothetical protein